MRSKLVLLILYPNDLRLDWLSRMGHRGCIGLVIKVWLVRRHRALSRVKGQMLSEFPMMWVVCNLRGVLLRFPVARVVCGWMGLLLGIHWMLLPMVWPCVLDVRWGGADGLPWRDDRSVWD